MEPPQTAHVEAVGWQLKPSYLLALLTLDATGCRVGELEAAEVGDLDEERGAWLVRAAVSKTRRPRWVDLERELLAAIVERLPAREDRHREARLFGDATANRLRTAIARACRDSGTPHFSPHALRHRRISLLHRHGVSWAEIGERVGQQSKLVTADTYTHALIDSSEVNRTKLLTRVRGVQTPVQTLPAEIAD
jgi:integrase